jgi:hypothetical protein
MGSQSAPIGTRLEGKFTSQLSIFSRFILGSSFGAETHSQLVPKNLCSFAMILLPVR